MGVNRVIACINLESKMRYISLATVVLLAACAVLSCDPPPNQANLISGYPSISVDGITIQASVEPKKLRSSTILAGHIWHIRAGKNDFALIDGGLYSPNAFIGNISPGGQIFITSGGVIMQDNNTLYPQIASKDKLLVAKMAIAGIRQIGHYSVSFDNDVRYTARMSPNGTRVCIDFPGIGLISISDSVVNIGENTYRFIRGGIICLNTDCLAFVILDGENGVKVVRPKPISNGDEAWIRGQDSF
jgi:hypothetical protein